MTRNIRAWTAEETETVRRMAAAGEDDDAIARALGRTPSSVAHRRRRAVVKLRGLKQWTADELRALDAKAAEGLDDDMIAVALGRTVRAVTWKRKERERAARVRAADGMATWTRYALATARAYGRRFPWLGDELESAVLVALWMWCKHHAAGGEGFGPSLRPLVAAVAGQAARKLVDSQIRHHRGRTRDRFVLANAAARGGDPAAAADARHDIRVMLAGLPRRQRRAVRLLYLRGMTPAAAGERLGVKGAEVVRRAEAGLKRLRERWAGGGR